MKKITLIIATFIGICLFFTISVRAQSGELKPFNENGKVGYKDENGNVVIQSTYEKGLEFSEGLAAVKQNGKWGYIDKTGKIVIPCEYIKVGKFSNGFAYVISKKFYIIDKNGNRVFSRHKIINTIYESSLFPCLKEIDKYHSKLNPLKPNNSVSFQINRPYLALSTDAYYKIQDTGELLQYSEADLDEKSVNNIKTLIGAYQYTHDNKTYSRGAYSNPITIESYGEVIIYYDVDGKKIIGYDVIKGEDLNLPSNIAIETLIMLQNQYVVKPDVIIKQIETHLSDSSVSPAK